MRHYYEPKVDVAGKVKTQFLKGDVVPQFSIFVGSTFYVIGLKRKRRKLACVKWLFTQLHGLIYLQFVQKP